MYYIYHGLSFHNLILPRLWIREKKLLDDRNMLTVNLFGILVAWTVTCMLGSNNACGESQKYARLKCHKLATEHAERLCGFQIRTYKFKITSFCFKNVRILDHYLIQFFFTIGQNNFWKNNKIIDYLNWKDFHNQISNLDNPSCSNVNASLPGLGIQDKFCLIFFCDKVFSQLKFIRYFQ